MRASERVFDCLYESDNSNIDKHLCIYCGARATDWDHVPPLHWVSRLDHDQLQAFRNHGHIKLKKWPSCGECNSLVAGELLVDLEDRRKFIAQRFKHKYAAWLRMPKWTDDDLDELSDDDARRFIKESVIMSEGLKQRYETLIIERDKLIKLLNDENMRLQRRVAELEEQNATLKQNLNARKEYEQGLIQERKTVLLWLRERLREQGNDLAQAISRMGDFDMDRLSDGRGLRAHHMG